MPGYHLVEQAPAVEVSPTEPTRPSERMGFLDFLRELHSDEPSVPRFWNVTVDGLEEVLFAVGPEADALASEIRQRLRAVASHLEKRLADVFVVFRGRLQRGDDLWSEYRRVRLPIGHIFGAPPLQTDEQGRRFYFANFNLTLGG